MRKSFVTRMLSVIMILTMAVSLMVGCGAKEEPVTEEPAATEEVEKVEEEAEAEVPAETIDLKIYTLMPEQPGSEAVNEALNAYTKEKYNMTCDWVYANGDYAEKMSVIIASGEEYDACWTSNWSNDYLSNVAKGAFVDITDMLKDTPDLYNVMPEAFWNATKVDGKIYAIPCQQIAARQLCIYMPKEFIEGTGVDATQISNFTNILEYAEKANEMYGAKVGCIDGARAFEYAGYEALVGGNTCPVAFKMGDDTATAVNFYETEDWKNLAAEIATLESKGLLDNETANDTELLMTQLKAKKISASFSGTVKPGVEAESEGSYGFKFICNGVDTKPYLNTSGIIATTYAISSTSKNPEATLKYLEIINTDPVCMQMLTHGVEGVNYKKTGDTSIEYIDAKVYSGWGWAFGNTYNTFTLPGQQEDLHAATAELNNNAMASALMGFAFNAEPVKLQISQVAKVCAEYEDIYTGLLPMEETTAEFNEKLVAAGINDIIAEAQAQVDEFLAIK